MADLKRVRIGTDIHLYPTIEEAGLDVAWSRVETIKPYIFSDTLRCPIGQCSYTLSEDGTEIDILFPASAQFFVGSYGENVCRLVMLVTIDGRESTYDMPAFVLVPLGDTRDIDDGDQSIRINLDRWSFGGASNPVDPAFIWNLFRAGTDEQINASHLRDAVEQLGILSLGNNYLNGVSGSGNGIITFARYGLSSIEFNARHTHVAEDVTNLKTVLDERYLRRDHPETLSHALTLYGGLKIGDGSGRAADIYYSDGRLVIDSDVYISGSLNGTSMGGGFDEATMWNSLGTSIYEKKIPARYLDVSGTGGGGDMASSLGNAGGAYNIGSDSLPVYFKNGVPVAITNLTLEEGVITAKTLKLGKVELTADDDGDLVIKGNGYSTGWFAVGGKNSSAGDTPGGGEEGGGEYTPYVLPIASASVLGGIKVGSGLSIAADGTLSTTGGSGGGTGGVSQLYVDSHILGKNVIDDDPRDQQAIVWSSTYNRWEFKSVSTGGSSGGSSSYTLPKATRSTLGGVIVGSGLAVNTSGVVSLDADGLYLRKTVADTAKEMITFEKGIHIGTSTAGVDLVYDSDARAIKIAGNVFNTGWNSVGALNADNAGMIDLTPDSRMPALGSASNLLKYDTVTKSYYVIDRLDEIELTSSSRIQTIGGSGATNKLKYDATTKSYYVL